MIRYRAPTKPSSNYITPAGEQAMKEELRQLWKVERPVVTQAVSDAAAQGDRSENGDYIYGKKRLREIDRRVRYLRKRLEHAIVVRELPQDRSKIYFGATVTLCDEEDRELSYRIVGADELSPEKGHISIDAPMAQSLLGKRVEDEVEVRSQDGLRTYWIVAIHYSTE